MSSNGKEITTHSLANIYSLMFAETRVPFYKYIALAKNNKSRQENPLNTATPTENHKQNFISFKRNSASRASNTEYQDTSLRKFSKHALPCILDKKTAIGFPAEVTLMPLTKYKKKQDSLKKISNKSVLLSSSSRQNPLNLQENSVNKTLLGQRNLLNQKYVSNGQNAGKILFKENNMNIYPKNSGILPQKTIIGPRARPKNKIGIKIIVDISSRLNQKYKENNENNEDFRLKDKENLKFDDFIDNDEILRPVFKEVSNNRHKNSGENKEKKISEQKRSQTVHERRSRVKKLKKLIDEIE